MMERVLMDSDRVARVGLEALLEGKPYVVPGLVNSTMAKAVKFVPKPIQALTAKQISK